MSISAGVEDRYGDKRPHDYVFVSEKSETNDGKADYRSFTTNDDLGRSRRIAS